MWQIILLIVGFVLLIKGADVFVDGASLLAKKLGVSDLLIGLTVVAFGTSAPELFVNVMAVIQGQAEITMGNIIGSNIYNILLILGISAVIYPLTVNKSTVSKEIPFALLAVFICGVLVSDVFLDHESISELTRTDGIVLLSFFGIFLYYIFEMVKEDAKNQEKENKNIAVWKVCLMVIFGLIAMVGGGRLVVDGAVFIAERLGVSKTLIGLTIVAIGTSLPELATSAVAAYRKNSDIAVGNIVGSNIFNVFLVLGVSALIHPIPVGGYMSVDILVVILSTLLLFFFTFTGKKRQIDRWEGWMFLVFCLIYTIFIIKRG